MTLSLPRKLAVFAGDIKLSHSVFALPVALLATCHAAATSGGLRVGHVVLIVVCMVAARTAAMGANRLLDARIDAGNPRTARRAIPSGQLSPAFVGGLVAVAVLVFTLGTVGFGVAFGNWLPLVLGPFVLAFICAYPLVKRFSRLCHYYLGAALALAPVCAEVAVAGRVSWWSVLLGVGVLLWTAGFDVIYATADVETDRRDGVHSMPAKLGVGRALWVSRATHVAAVLAYVLAGIVSPLLGGIWFVAVAAVAALLAAEQALVRADDLSKVGLAFFTFNGIVALVLGVAGIVDVYV